MLRGAFGVGFRGVGLLFLAVLVGLATFGCGEGAYRAAAKTDTPAAYRRFLTEHPRHPAALEAAERLAQLEFDAARAAHSVLAYKRFLAEFPGAPQAPLATALLETLRFTFAESRGDAASWRAFLQDHPEGAHREEAERRLAEVEYEALARSDEVAGLRRFIGAHADDARTAELAAKLDRLSFEKATNAERVFAYLRDFPSGAHRDAARLRLLSWQLEGLLVSGEVAEAQALASKSPLASQLADLPARLERAHRKQRVAESKDPRLAGVFAAFHVRRPDELAAALATGDPMDRWEAAQELGQVISVQTLDPLLRALRDSTVPLVRWRAFESLRGVLRALPSAVVDYELSLRREALATQAADARLVALAGILFDLAGELGRAATEYQRAWSGGEVDPLVLWRWTNVRRERGQHSAAAVAARHLSLWAGAAIERFEPVTPGNALLAAREACGALWAARFVAEVLREAQASHPDFPEDVEDAIVKNDAVRSRVEARLRDAELQVLEAAPRTRLCSDTTLHSRLEEAQRARLHALEALRRAKHPDLPLVLELVRERDASEIVRAAARD